MNWQNEVQQKPGGGEGLRLTARNGWALNFSATNWTSGRSGPLLLRYDTGGWGARLPAFRRNILSRSTDASLPVATRRIPLTCSRWRNVFQRERRRRSVVAFTACVRNKRTGLQNRDNLRLATPAPPKERVTPWGLRFSRRWARGLLSAGMWCRVGGTCCFRLQGRKVSQWCG
jgi:hypothetical protein